MMSSIPSSLEYTHSVRYTVVDDPRWIALCASLRGKSVSHLRAMAKSSFNRLEGDLGHDLDFHVMCTALYNFFYWTDFMNLFAREMRWRRPRHLSLLQDAHPSDLSQAMRNRGWLTQVTRKLTTNAAHRRKLDRGSIPHAERDAVALRVKFGTGLVRSLEVLLEI
ncbi:hypothetical protein LIER_33144 [Lithospermum erythrorhizon]|uniref:Uncharacterized protein n=1 Tax=Lithospermum erythrorhizon TaxID=34254 RepID=A0AAV3RVT5_LITER